MQSDHRHTKPWRDLGLAEELKGQPSALTVGDELRGNEKTRRIHSLSAQAWPREPETRTKNRMQDNNYQSQKTVSVHHNVRIPLNSLTALVAW